MDEALVKRLLGVGFLVLLLTIVFLLINERRADNFAISAPIPPDFNRVEIDTALVPDELSDISQKFNNLKNSLRDIREPANNERSEDDRKTIDDRRPGIANILDSIDFGGRSVPTRWAVQVASFYDDDNAQLMKQELASQGFASVVRASVSSNNEVIHAVYLGPFLQRTRAEDARKKLIEETELDEGIIRQWQQQ